MIDQRFIKMANLLALLQKVQQSEHNQPFMSSLYLPLMMSDLGEAWHRYKQRGIGSAVVPALGGLALGTMLAHHAVNPLLAMMQKHKLQSAGDVAKHLLGRLQPAVPAQG